jgi:hypothetical protein
MTHRPPDETTVDRAMKALAEIEAGVETPPRVEAAVMAKWDADLSRRSTAKADLSRRSIAKADHALRTRPRTSGFVRVAATAAAGITLLGALMWQRGSGTTATRETAAVGGSSQGATRVVVPADATASVVSGFLGHRSASREGGSRTVAPTEPAAFTFVGEPPLANEPVWIIRMRVAPSALTELGIRSTTQADTVDIDVLVGEDGVARGVRMSM